MPTRRAVVLNNSPRKSSVSRRRPVYAPGTRVTERYSQNARTGRIEWCARNGLALVQWNDGTTSHGVTFNLCRAGDR